MEHPEDVVGTASLVQAFNALEERDREALALVAWDGLAPHEAAIVVGAVGHLRPEKNLARLFEAIARAPRANVAVTASRAVIM